jgi:hypothetical protein
LLTGFQVNGDDLAILAGEARDRAPAVRRRRQPFRAQPAGVGDLHDLPRSQVHAEQVEAVTAAGRGEQQALPRRRQRGVGLE